MYIYVYIIYVYIYTVYIYTVYIYILITCRYILYIGEPKKQARGGERGGRERGERERETERERERELAELKPQTLQFSASSL